MSFKSFSNTKEKQNTAPERRKSLGRGLESLFSPLSGSSLSGENIKKTSENTKVLLLGIEQIQTDPNQPRRVFNKESLAELAQSIKQNGLIQAVIVRQVGAKYEIVAGERRWRAAAMAGVYEIPVRVIEPKQDNPFLSLVENLQRQDLNPIELAQAYQKLMKKLDFTQEKLAYQLGIPRATLANQIRILNLPESVQQLILQGKISLALAKLLLKHSDVSFQIKWAQYFANNKIGVRTAQKLLSQNSLTRIKSNEQPLKSWQNQAINKIQEIHGVKTSIQLKKKGGKLILRFFSDKELHYLMDILVRQK